MPTYRDNAYTINGEDAFIFDMPGFDLMDFNQYLCENNILFISRMHSSHVIKKHVIETAHMRVLTDDILNAHDMDLYEVLNGIDCLISDYSSVIIDYLLTDKPMIFTPTDLDSYSNNKGLMFEPYDAWVPGDIALDYKQLTVAISKALFGEDVYRKDRERLRRITHKYADAKSAERVLMLARELLGL
jgi:CDP-glycerol glycerophosphotransferase (TagB/SpsB family)